MLPSPADFRQKFNAVLFDLLDHCRGRPRFLVPRAPNQEFQQYRRQINSFLCQPVVSPSSINPLRLSGDDSRLRPLAGVYGRTDTDRGVWVAPTNVPLIGVSGLSQDLTAAESDALNSVGIDVMPQYYAMAKSANAGSDLRLFETPQKKYAKDNGTRNRRVHRAAH